MMRWWRPALVAVSTAALLGVGALAGAATTTAATANHAFLGGRAGFIGCFDDGQAPRCLEAIAESDGLHVSYFDGLFGEEAVDPSGSITATTVGNTPAVAVDTTLPNAGVVHIVSAGGANELGVGCEACWRPNYRIRTEDGSYGLSFGTQVTGTVAGTPVSNRDRYPAEFDSHWLGTAVDGFYGGPAVGLY